MPMGSCTLPILEKILLVTTEAVNFGEEDDSFSALVVLWF